MSKLSTYNSIISTNLKEVFMNETKDNKDINSSFNNLWSFHRNFYGNSSFFNYTLQGHLVKCMEAMKLFKKKQHIRYFILDFSKTTLDIK